MVASNFTFRNGKELASFLTANKEALTQHAIGNVTSDNHEEFQKQAENAKAAVEYITSKSGDPAFLQKVNSANLGTVSADNKTVNFNTEALMNAGKETLAAEPNKTEQHKKAEAGFEHFANHPAKTSLEVAAAPPEEGFMSKAFGWLKGNSGMAAGAAVLLLGALAGGPEMLLMAAIAALVVGFGTHMLGEQTWNKKEEPVVGPAAQVTPGGRNQNTNATAVENSIIPSQEEIRAMGFGEQPVQRKDYVTKDGNGSLAEPLPATGAPAAASTTADSALAAVAPVATAATVAEQNLPKNLFANAPTSGESKLPNPLFAQSELPEQVFAPGEAIKKAFDQFKAGQDVAGNTIPLKPATAENSRSTAR